MKKFVISVVLCFCSVTVCFGEDPSAAARYQREAEYYQRQAESYARDAESYLRAAKSKENDAAYYLRNKRYDKARDYFREAANKMDWYQDKLDAARRAASTAEDYLKRAADALR